MLNSIQPLQLRNPLLQSLNLDELDRIKIDPQDSIVQPRQSEKLVIIEIASAHIDRILVRDNLSATAPAPEGNGVNLE